MARPNVSTSAITQLKILKRFGSLETLTSQIFRHLDEMYVNDYADCLLVCLLSLLNTYFSIRMMVFTQKKAQVTMGDF